jgi:hypothetical protein
MSSKNNSQILTHPTFFIKILAYCAGKRSNDNLVAASTPVNIVQALEISATTSEWMITLQTLSKNFFLLFLSQCEQRYQNTNCYIRALSFAIRNRIPWLTECLLCTYLSVCHENPQKYPFSKLFIDTMFRNSINVFHWITCREGTKNDRIAFFPSLKIILDCCLRFDTEICPDPVNRPSHFLKSKQTKKKKRKNLARYRSFLKLVFALYKCIPLSNF